MKILVNTLGVIAITLFASKEVQARKYDLYWIGFKDKKDTPYSIFNPQEYLSARALERRSRYGIHIDSLDLPINQKYLEPIKIKGFEVHLESKWLNGVIVKVPENLSVSPEDLLTFDFVKEVFPIGFSRKVLPIAEKGERDYNNNYKKRKKFYGYGTNQIEMLNGQYLHRMGYKGEGMLVAIFDGGFEGMLETPAFDSIYKNNQILGTKDFVEGDDYVYESTTHGRDVLSTMASNMPYLFVGTAPKAQYYLFKTEDHPLGEYVAEEYYWLAAAEYADQIGVYIINSSLGYHSFDDDKMDYAYVDLDGNYSTMTKAARIAADKGILVVSAAGNEGRKKWKHITVPNDAENILTVGAVDRDGYHASFSSYGFEDRNIIKPNVVARGAIAVIAAKKKYGTSFSNGTSFASPIMAGMVTTFWQAFPELTNKDIIYTLQNHASQKDSPDNALGYGVPDFLAAHITHRNSVIELKNDQSYYKHIEDLDHRFDLFMKNIKAVDINYRLYNSIGQVVYEGKEHLTTNFEKKLWHLSIPVWNELPNTVYTLELDLDGDMKRILLTK